MDGETIRLIVVACGAVLAGLSGALIAGAYNSRNTLATIEAARVAAETQREADREVEHDRWLRDRKVVVYANLLAQLQAMDLEIQTLHLRPNQIDMNKLTNMSKELGNDELMLLAPTEIRAAIGPAWRELRGMIALLQTAQPSDEQKDQFEALADDFLTHFKALQVLLRADLGVENEVGA